MMEENKRELFLDRLRVAATCAVVLLHTITGIMDITDMSEHPFEKTVFLVCMDLITWCVPVFLMISGYLFLDLSKEITFLRMLTKYCRRILLALFVFGVPYSCMELVMTEHTFRAGMPVEAFLMVCRGRTWSHMWYLYLILLLYLITPGLRFLLKKVPLPFWYAVLGLLLLFCSIFPFVNKLMGQAALPMLPDGGIYLFYYLCGHLLVRRRKSTGTGKSCCWIHTGGHLLVSGRKQKGENSGGADAIYSGEIFRRVAAGAVILLFAGMAVSRLAGDYSVRMAYNYPFTVVVSLLLVWLAAEAEKETGPKNTTLLITAGGLCFAVYLVHPVFLNFFFKFLNITLFDYPIGFSLPVMFAAVLLLSVVTAWVLRKIPALKKYVL